MTGSLKDLYNWSQDQKSTHLMPALFIGHGSPMNGIEDNEFSRQWSILGKEIPKPSAVLVVSAHWLTRGTWITAMAHPKTIHDFGGFPQELFEVQYPALGSPKMAKETSELITSVPVGLDHEWGLDHGTWMVVRHMYPEANIPVLQLSIDYYESPDFHYRLGKELGALRKRGVLIIGSGNMVHNLRMVAWDKLNESEFGFDWALEMNTLFKTKIESKDHRDLIDYKNLGHAGRLAIPTPDHYFPLLYLLGIQGEKEDVSFFNDKAVGGSLTMTSVKFG
ncbi:4,5-DOPA dioxygenase extradiol [Cognataquiflexum rubidum]|uniref:4,5-DOPA-extradiol-dioxygenase n=1 Tax=Cognataquiflexum rubidum TaxID=2922273 RepID=UPI001F148D51|nr:4,5-DOPA dioxygenase extradiol [Cognataquiflexum rubidum]MCH6235135.1 4,5-DOPA dioxygenase extradiol [Cognataquiflexum rubidum]